MNEEVDILDTSVLQFNGDFDTQVQDILYFVRLTADRVHNLKHLFDDLEEALQHLVPGCHIVPFGSIVTGLGIKTSDVDCYVYLPDGTPPTIKHITSARSVLKRYPKKFTNVFAITSAKVPIVKFRHQPTNCDCDVNFKSPIGIHNSRLIAFMLHWDNQALPLAVLIKYWSKVHKITGTNLMPNYALIMMVIFYLQQKNMLPSVYELQNNVPPYYINEWNTAFDNTVCRPSRTSDSLYDLLGGFFKYFSTFNYEQSMISPFIGSVVMKKSFEDMDNVPEKFGLYKELVSKNPQIKLKVDSKFCIQDPFEHNKNCSAAVLGKFADKIMALFKFASKKFEEEEAESFLKAIFTQDPFSVPPITFNKNEPKIYVIGNRITKHNPKKTKRDLHNNLKVWVNNKNR